MYDIRQFKPSLYLVLILGISGFCFAAETPGVWLLALLAVAFNGWLVRSGRFMPFPRWLANTATLLAAGFVVVQMMGAGGPPLLLIGQFLVLMHIIKLFEQRTNRDYAQLLVLSLLLMVAGSINTASLLFAVLLVLYLVVALYCCLIFHLKVEADRARSALAIPLERLSPAALELDQRFLARSMRRLTGVALAGSIAGATAVFLLFPRGSGLGVLGQMQVRPPGSMTGFSDRISLSQINRIRQNEELVAHVQVWRNGKALAGSEPLYLRGLTLDTYGADAGRGYGRAEWSRSHLYQRGENREFYEGLASEGELPAGADLWRQRFALRPTGSRPIFALPGLATRVAPPERLPAFEPSRPVAVRYFDHDNSLQAIDPINAPLEYEVYSTNAARTEDAMAIELRQRRQHYTDSDPDVLRQVREYVAAQALADDLLRERGEARPVDPSNEQIARRFEQHLRGPDFSYTLDLTPLRSSFQGRDPVVAFLSSVKRGHCELFASAMVLMCQSAGIPARMVVGFRCDEYNVVGRYYMVRQAHAHSWVEVMTPEGWMAFDPTSGREARAVVRASLWNSLKHMVDFLEYKWGENVIAFDRGEQTKLMVRLAQIVQQAQGLLIRVLDDFSFRRLLAVLDEIAGHATFWQVFLDILIVVISLMVAAILVAIGWFLLQQRRLKRRAARIGFDALPMGEQLRLARQLRFYDQLTRALNRHRIVRPKNLTPMEFAQSLSFLPAEAYDAVHRLTQLLYRVRFGQTSLTPSRQRRLETVVERIASALDGMMHPSAGGARGALQPQRQSR